jgi:hypothetical protein
MAHNGWTNYETWTVIAWIDNTLEPYKYWQAVASIYADHERTKDGLSDMAGPRAVCDMAEKLENELGKNFLLKKVNWYEIARSLIDDAKEENQD